MWGTLKAKRMAKAMSMTAVLSESSTRPLLRPPPGLREGPLAPPGPWLFSLHTKLCCHGVLSGHRHTISCSKLIDSLSCSQFPG